MSPMYHERQSKQLCLLHSLNNLYQKNVFHQNILDGICSVLSPQKFVNPHKSFLGLGNYDVNVMMKAVQTMGHEVVWFDKRLDPDILMFENIFGIILNLPTSSYIPPFHRKHWIAVRESSGQFYNLDSKFKTPEQVGTESEFKTYLKDKLKSLEVEIFLIVDNKVQENGAWKRADH